MFGSLALACQSGAVLQKRDLQTGVIYHAGSLPKRHVAGGQIRAAKGVDFPDHLIQTVLKFLRFVFLQTQEEVIRFHTGGKFIVRRPELAFQDLV